MKKICALILALILILAAVPAGAETVTDALAEFTDEELLRMITLINAEILRRKGEPFTVYPGIYVVGEDFPAGTYRVERVKGTGSFFLYENEEKVSTGLPYYNEFMCASDIGTDVIGKVKLINNTVLDLGVTVTMVPYTGISQ